VVWMFRTVCLELDHMKPISQLLKLLRDILVILPMHRTINTNPTVNM